MSTFTEVEEALDQGDTICFISPHRPGVIYKIYPEWIDDYNISLFDILYADWFVEGDR